MAVIIVMLVFVHYVIGKHRTLCMLVLHCSFHIFEVLHGVLLEHKHLIFVCKIIITGVSADTVVGRNDFILCSFIHPLSVVSKF